MSREEILEKAIYIQFPLNYTVYKDYSIPNKEIHKLPIPEPGMMYDKWPLNDNHFQTLYHRQYVIPMLIDLLHLDYNPNDFTLDERKYNDFDISIYKPVKDFRFELFGYSMNEHFEDVDWNVLSNSKMVTSEVTKYHALYAYPHRNSRIINKTIDSDRIILISGDSQMIPNIAFLACFFKELFYFDNRYRTNLTGKWSDVDFTDVLIELNCKNLFEYTHGF